MNAANQTRNNPAKYYLSLGSNIEPEKNIPKAITLLKEYGNVEAVSSAWRSAAIGTSGPAFLNAAVLFISTLSSRELKIQVLQKIEKQIGRVRSSDKNAPRPIDIDILISGSEELDENIWKTAHLAIPLAEIYSLYRNPSTGESIKSAAQRLARHTNISIEKSLKSE